MFVPQAHEELWFDCAQKLTSVIQQIIEFAKAVPGFRKFSQDDQIVLLKAGSFELAVLRMTRYYDVNQNCVVYGDTLLPMEAFLTTETVEMKLVNNVFEFAKTVAELKLTDTELGLYSALVLLQADREGLRGTEEIAKLNDAVGRSLRMELEKTHRYPVKGDVTVHAFLIAKMPALSIKVTSNCDPNIKFFSSLSASPWHCLVAFLALCPALPCPALPLLTPRRRPVVVAWQGAQHAAPGSALQVQAGRASPAVLGSPQGNLQRGILRRLSRV
ncbi:putative nuclear hormone receptor HR3 [Chionoecetes opilio]|uniref:Putative nuclear hormone receptor HR3 n=1 Tax=Chionoecetes opilio TaxID=41210 RepID=A0A8J4Y6R9_CHIOP|nr:putative nuclear hormone receptor HR3 [Chionoecetes opilio]